MLYLIECLQKTPPPVVVFSDNKNEVDGEDKLPSVISVRTSAKMQYFLQIFKNTCFSKVLRLSLFTAAKVSASDSRW